MAVNKVDLNGKTLLDLTDDTVTPENLDYGVTAHAANGQVITGVRLHCKTYSTNSPAMTAENDVFSWTIPATEHGLDSGNLLVSVYDNAGKKVLCDIGISTDYAVAVSFVSNGSSAADAGAYKVVIVGCKSVPIEEETPDPVSIIYGGTGARTASQARNNLGFTLDNLIPRNAGAHNAIYRGQNLGSAVTAAQWAAIGAGTFDDLYIGDYWEINGIIYYCAGFDYYLGTGDTPCTDHHITMVPAFKLYDHAMNDTNVTTGAYVGSKMRTEGLNPAKTTINNAFGSSHILNHRQYLHNATINGYTSEGSWYDSTVELMTEQNVYGCKVFGNCVNGTGFPNSLTVDKSQYPLFAFRPDLISNQHGFWLRDVAFDTNFCNVRGDGVADSNWSNGVFGVRPAFSICA